jgi:hypothetical protein
MDTFNQSAGCLLLGQAWTAGILADEGQQRSRGVKPLATNVQFAKADMQFLFKRPAASVR